MSLSVGSAVLGQDFIFSDTTITFPAFSADTQGVWVTVLNNNVYEANKQANFNLSNPTNGGILGITGFTLTIINNDSLAGGIAGSGFLKGVNIMPNPVTNNLLIQTAEDLTSVDITDLVGNRIVRLNSIATGTSSVDVSSLSPGVYFLNVRGTDKIYSERFVKTE